VIKGSGDNMQSNTTINTVEGSAELLLAGRPQVAIALTSLNESGYAEELAEDLAHILDVHEQYHRAGRQDDLEIYITQDIAGEARDDIISSLYYTLDLDNDGTDEDRANKVKSEAYMLWEVLAMEGIQKVRPAQKAWAKARDPLGPLDVLDFYEGTLLQTEDRDLADAIKLLDTDEDKLNFSLGLLQVKMAKKHSILQLFSHLSMALHTAYQSDEEEYRRAKDSWQPIFKFARIAQDIPHFRSKFIDGNEDQPFNIRELASETSHHSEEEIIDAINLFNRAKNRLQSVQGVRVIIGNTANRYLLNVHPVEI